MREVLFTAHIHSFHNHFISKMTYNLQNCICLDMIRMSIKVRNDLQINFKTILNKI